MIARNAAPGSPNAALLTSTYAVIFFGTPHSGTKDTPLAQVLNQVMSAYTRTNNQVLQRIKEKSEALEDIQRMYFQASAGLRTIYFYEEYAMPVIGGGSLIVSVLKYTLTGAHV